MRRTERLAAWLVLAAAGAAVALLGASPGWQLLAAGGFAAVAFGLWRAGWIGSRYRVVDLPWPPGELSADTRVYSGAVWLSWKRSGGQPDHMFLVRSDLPAGQLRALCVRLRTAAAGRENVQ